MKKVLTVLLLFAIGSCFSQNFEDTWEGFFSYVSVKDISQGDDRVYAAAENAVFTFDLSTQEINTIDSVRGLSGEDISSIYYSEDFNLLLIGYENGLIEVVQDGDDDVLQVVDILDKLTIPPNRKQINHFFEYEGNVYIATDFGISVYDLAALEFGDTYFIGASGEQLVVNQTTVALPYIYAATEGGGIRRALVENDNLIDFAQWNQIFGGSHRGIQHIEEEVFWVRDNNAIYRFTETDGISVVENFSERVQDFSEQDNVLVITTTSSIQAYTSGYVQQSRITSLSNFDLNLQSGFAFNGLFYLGTRTSGMLQVPFSTNTATQILPDGPILNTPFSIDSSPGQLWVTFGDITQFADPFPLSEFGVSNLREGSWTNIPFSQLDPSGQATDLVNVTINPNDPNDVYMSSFIGGILKINDQTPEILIDENNSNLETVIVDGNSEDSGLRMYGSEFDREGNIWFGQALAEEGLVKRLSNSQFEKIDITDAITNPQDELGLVDLKISREGFVCVGTINNGLLVYNPSTGEFTRLLEEEGNGNLPRNTVRAIEFDLQNRLWIGTTFGLRVSFNVGGLFEEGADIDAQEIIILQDGIPRELLADQNILDIEVDGSNNKWVATADAGVFYLSPNGQETLQRFTKDNSPLPSNNVQDIAIDDFSGRVYFATVNGLVAFEGTFTAPRDNLENVYAYPNPVRPGFTGNVTIDGLTANANVKITDIEGNLVFETTSEGGSVLWDTTAFGKYKVASGVYLVLITTDDALETTVSKIMVVR